MNGEVKCSPQTLPFKTIAQLGTPLPQAWVWQHEAFLQGNTAASRQCPHPWPTSKRGGQEQQFTATSAGITHQSLVLDLLPDQLVLTEGVAGLARDGVDRALLHLLLDGTVEHEERFPSTLLWDRDREEKKRG